MPRLKLRFSRTELILNLRDTPTANAILEACPIESTTHTWGDEVYFEVPVSATLEADAKSVVDAGEIAFWTEGNCIAIGFGPTPISQANEIRLAAATNIWADSETDVVCLKEVSAGEKVQVEVLSE